MPTGMGSLIVGDSLERYSVRAGSIVGIVRLGFEEGFRRFLLGRWRSPTELGNDSHLFAD